MSLLTETPLFEALFEEVMQGRLLETEQRVQAAVAQQIEAEQARLQAEQRAQTEVMQRLEADQARLQAEQKAERLAARLRELGIDPEQVD